MSTSYSWAGQQGKPVAERWSRWVDSGLGTTVVISVNSNDECRITMGGVANGNRWGGGAAYEYTVKSNKYYTYEIEAWTEDGSNREVLFQYFRHDYGDGNILRKERPIHINGARTIYTINGDILPESGVKRLTFQSMHQLGSYFIKIVSITENSSFEVNYDGLYWGDANGIGNNVRITGNSLSYVGMNWPGTEIGGSGNRTIEIVYGGKMVHESGDAGQWAYVKWGGVNKGILVYVIYGTHEFYEIGLGNRPYDGANEVIATWTATGIGRPNLAFFPPVSLTGMNTDYSWAGQQK